MAKLADSTFLNCEAQPQPFSEADAQSPIDLVHLSRQTFGDHDLERELLALFDAQAAQYTKRLRAPAARGDDWRIGLAHTIKGSARAIGAFEVGQAAEAYEQALRSADASAAEKAEILGAAIGRARGAIALLLGGAAQNGPTGKYFR
ncbi:Hpt domain-containing protein [Methylocystis sp. SC2]|uniref:Hpt domain-containing protein n=1 Tax=Methylocystis sp. (strain SC2) TaxID=187303 RepID=UPI0011D2657E|nr:Hpt domain-containing protein [Methylocystis sp. SC2]